MSQSVQIEILEGRIVLCHKHFSIAEFWVDKSGSPHLRRIADVDTLGFTSPKSAADLDVKIVTKENSSVGLPHRIVEKATDKTYAAKKAKTPKPTYSSSGDHINHSERDAILSHVLDSLIDEPNATKKRSAQISKEIAEKLGVKPMAVAGVKANLARGVYGDVQSIISYRSKHRKENSWRNGLTLSR